MPVKHDHQPSVFALNVSRRVLLSLACLLLGAGPVAAATYYVTTGGSDTNAGTQAAPWRTLAKANATLVAGDACVIAAGTYSDPISPAAGGSAGARISYVGNLASPTSVVVASISINRAYITVKGVRTTSGCQLYYTSESAKPVRDSIAYCNIAGNLDFWGAKNCSVSRCTINGTVSFVMDRGFAGNPDPWTANSAVDTLRYNTINAGAWRGKLLQLRGYTQYCVIDSNRFSGTFTVANGGDSAYGRYLYNSYYNTFRDNSWRFEADGELGGGGEFTAFAMRDSSSYNLFERDTMLCGVQSGFTIGGRLCNSGSAPGQNLCVGNRWNRCFYQTTGWVANLELLNGAIIENSFFASSNNPGLWLLSNVQNTTIRNCTFYSLRSPAIQVDGDLRVGGANQIYNNIFYADSVAACFSKRPVMFQGYGTGFSEDYNVFHSRAATAGVTASSQAVYWASSACSPVGAGTAWASTSGNDIHSKWGAPLFNDDRWATFDPRLRAGSAAIGAAQGGGDAGAYPFVPGGVDVTPPAAVTNLTLVQLSNDYALLSWTAPGDNGMTGTVAAYDLRYSTQPVNAANFAAATQVPTVPAILPAGSSQSYVMTGLTASTTYYFALKARDEAGNWSSISNVPTGVTTATDVVPPARITDFR